MKKIKCWICGKDISDYNLDDSMKIQCDMCTLRKVLYLEELEKETGIKIINKDHYKIAKAEKENNTSRNLMKELKEKRKSKGWTTRFLGSVLGVSHVYVTQMENGSKPLNKKALEFIS